MKKHDIIEVAGAVVHQTSSAYLFDGGTEEKVWLPKSLCEWEPQMNVANTAIMGIMQMPEWLALEKELI